MLDGAPARQIRLKDGTEFHSLADAARFVLALPPHYQERNSWSETVGADRLRERWRNESARNWIICQRPSKAPTDPQWNAGPVAPLPGPSAAGRRVSPARQG